MQKIFFREIKNKTFIKTSDGIKRTHNLFNFSHFSFSENFDEIPKAKIKEIRGIIPPFINNPKSSKSSPKQEFFYGVPYSKEIPKSKDDLIKKFEYVNNFDDMVDLYLTAQSHFSGHELSLFLERLSLIYHKELRSVLNKHKEQKFVLKKESQIKAEYEEKLNSFLDDMEKLTKEKNFDFYEIVVTYFEVFYRFKRDIPKEAADIIFEKSKLKESFTEGKFKKLDLIKLTFILSRYKRLLNSKQNAEEGLEIITEELMKIGINNFTKEEMKQLILNLSYKNVYPDLELFTKFEPHVLKYLNEYDVTSLINIFSAYIKNYRGSNFFIQALGFSLASNLQYCTLKDLIFLLELSPKKFFNRPELSIKFSDLFLNTFALIQPKLSELKAKEISLVIKALINTSFNDKKFLHLLSTVYLKFADREELHHLIYMMYYFAVCDLENTNFCKKTLEVLNLNLICLKNYIEGNEDLDNLVGIYDKKFVKKLSDFYCKNIENTKDKLKYFDRILYSEDEVFALFDYLLKLTWTSTFYISKIKDAHEEVKELVLNMIQIFNIFVSNLNQCEENGITINITKSNIDKLFLSYVFLLINSEKFKLKLNLNLEFLKISTIKINGHEDEVYEYDKFLKFREKVKSAISTLDNFKHFSYCEDYSDITNYNIFKYLKCDFIRKKEVEDKVIDEVIFINDPYDYFEISLNHTGYNKFRRTLCKLLDLKFVEVDYHEFLIFYQDCEINEENLGGLVQEFLQIKLG